MKKLFLLLLALTCFQFSYGDNVSSQLDVQVKDQIKSKFINGDALLRFRSDILIRLQGNTTKDDSLIFNQLIDTLNVLTDKLDIYLFQNRTSNLVVEIINSPINEFQESRILQHSNTSEIIKVNVILNLPTTIKFAARKKRIFYYMLHSLVDQRKNPTKKAITGSVFTETNPDRITFHPIDFKIIKEIYSNEYNEKPENKSNSNNWSSYNFQVLINLIAILVSMIYLILISQKGILKKHHFEFGSFLKQGILAFVAFLFYYVIKTVFMNILLFKSIVEPPVNFGLILIIGLLGLVSIIFIFL